MQNVIDFNRARARIEVSAEAASEAGPRDEPAVTQTVLRHALRKLVEKSMHLGSDVVVSELEDATSAVKAFGGLIGR